jgi:hypothetical protein
MHLCSLEFVHKDKAKAAAVPVLSAALAGKERQNSLFGRRREQVCDNYI